MNRFFINETLVDIERCRLIRDGETIALEPRVIQVLELLARHQGEVVSHQVLLDAIWTNTIVEPSALQRCIAQLRKAFRDDARQQHVIATYPKRGYSLVAPIRPVPESPLTGTTPAANRQRILWPALAAALVTAFLVFVDTTPMAPAAGVSAVEPNAIIGQGASSPIPPLLSNPALLAVTTNPDDFPVYSPDGRFVIYPRYLDEDHAHLWARDLAYGSDFLLTAEAGIYEHLAWSRDSSQLVFVDATCQPGKCARSSCFTLKSVAISQSETNVPLVEKLIDCSPSRLLSPEWLNNRELAVIEVDDSRATLVRYDLKNHARRILYQSADPVPYRLSFSRQTDTLTIMAMSPQGRKELLFLNINSGAVSRNDRAVFTPEEDWYPSSNPL